MNPGEIFADRYRILRLIGQGAAGTVYQATDTRLDREVALKILTSSGATVPARFVREARTVARLTHQNIVSIFDIGEAGGQLFLAQELLVGRSLGDVLRGEGRIVPAIVVEVLRQVASALAYAHASGVVHRDVKPGNIFVTRDGTVKLLDFGIAKLADEAALTAVGGGLIGTASYAAPEQVLGAEVDARADVFALGAVGFEMVAGRRPFEGETLAEVVSRRLNAATPRLRDVVPDSPPALDALIARCMAREPADRPASMQEVIAGLDAVAVDVPPQPLAQWPALLEDSGHAADTAAPHASPAEGTLLGPVVTPDWAGKTVIHGAPSAGGAAAPARAGRFEPAESALPDGTRIGRFTLLEPIAQGQTGNLYKAFDPVRSRLVGVKVITRPTSVAVNRLLRAARIWLDLRHPHLQTILEVDPGADAGPALVVTELIEGIDLRRLLDRRRLDLGQKIEVALQVCDALDYMHGNGVIHREIKPSNIILTTADLRVKLLDSGLARSVDTNEQLLTTVGAAVGDLRYMAPEQGLGRSDERSDVYSLGVVLYEMCIEEPFDGTQPEAMAARLDAANHLPAKLVATIGAALQPDRNRRLAGVREVADSLRTFVPEKLPPLPLSHVVVTLHGIRTHARWQRAFSEVASRAGLHCQLDRWNFGYFSILRFLMPWSRHARVSWFRATYHDEFGDRAASPLSTERPSIVAHSFGTYILGNAMLRYPYLRFNKVLLCGSILPEAFPWDVLIDRGQVQAVRNEFGARDTWTRLAQAVVPGTGPSGMRGFLCTHERFEQERFDFSHSEYFERGHMEEKWLPFIRRRVAFITPRERTVEAPRGTPPLGLYLLYASLAALAAAVAGWML